MDVERVRNLIRQQLDDSSDEEAWEPTSTVMLENTVDEPCDVDKEQILS